MGSSSWILVCTQFWRVRYFVWLHVLRGSNAGWYLYHIFSARQASQLIAPHQQRQYSWWWWNSIFSWERRVVRLEAKLRNTPSQLETKERAAKGAIAQSWLTVQYTTHIHMHTHSHHLFTLHSAFSLLFFVFFLHPSPFPAFTIFTLSLSFLISFMHYIWVASTFSWWPHRRQGFIYSQSI